MRSSSLLFLTTLLFSIVGLVYGCYPTSFTVTLSGADKGLPGIYHEEAVHNHVDYLTAWQSSDYRQNGHHTFACVDSRSDHPQVATPGGDIAEFSGAMYVYFNLTGQTPTLASVRSLFQSFVSKHITAARPFYYHTDDTKIKYAYAAVSARLNKNITILPVEKPDAEEEEVWYEELTDAHVQGCGHMRLMIGNPGWYGMKDAVVPQTLIRVFIEEWWNAATNEERAKYAFTLKVGPLQGKAVAVVSNAGPNCQGYSPALQPNFLASSMFVYHPDSATAFREQILAPFFVNQPSSGLKQAQFVAALADLQATQLTATLTYLSPANATNLYSVSVSTAGIPLPSAAWPKIGAVSGMAMYAPIVAMAMMFAAMQFKGL